MRRWVRIDFKIVTQRKMMEAHLTTSVKLVVAMKKVTSCCNKTPLVVEVNSHSKGKLGSLIRLTTR